MIQQVSDFELELMKTIWRNGGAALYAEIVAALNAKGAPATKNTIISLLSRLIDKGYLSSKKKGRCNTYTALISEAEYQEMCIRDRVPIIGGIPTRITPFCRLVRSCMARKIESCCSITPFAMA